jgi:hypothetical protein
MLQATNRPKLARLAVDIISAIEQITENVSLLPVCIQSNNAITRLLSRKLVQPKRVEKNKNLII